MRRSRLEVQVDILNVIAQEGPLQLNNIINRINLSGKLLMENLSFLIKQGLIEEVTVGKNGVSYANTNRGAAVVRFFSSLRKTLSVKEENKFTPISY
jgi:predicted transcriptional regulator